MKKNLTAIFLTVFFAQSVFAQLIANSELEADHQKVIIEAIRIHCAVPYLALAQTAPTVRTNIKVDNGITDVQYETTLGAHGISIQVSSLYTQMNNVGDGSRYSVTDIKSDYCMH